MWLETQAGDRFADIRVREALAVGATAIITACPLCIACLEDSLNAHGLEELEVLDVAEIATLALDAQR